MKKTGIMTDSHSGILNEEAERLGIKVLPMPFYIEEKVYREGVDLSREEFYDMLRKGTDVSTSQPSLVEVAEMWKEMLKEYEEIVYIPLSSALSGSCMAATAMANEDEFAGKVFVVDNGRVATPMHRSVLDAVEMTEKGYSAAEIKKILEETREKMTIYIGLSTLEYLKKGGRISKTVAFAGGVLNIKPVVTVQDGVVALIGKARGSRHGNNLLVEKIREAGGIDFSLPVLLGYSGLSDTYLKKYVEDSRDIWQDKADSLDSTLICSVIGTHTGPGVVAVAFFKKG